MRLTRPQAAARGTLRELLARPPLEPQGLGALLAATLRDAVGWDSHRLFTVDPVTNGLSRLLDASEDDALARAIWLQETYMGSDSAMIAAIERMVGERTLPRAMAIQSDLERCHGWPLGTWDDGEQRRFRQLFIEGSERYRLPARLTGAVTVSPVVAGTPVGHLVAWRMEPSSPFTVGDVAFLNLVSAAVGELMDAAIRADRLRPQPVPEGSGVVLLGADGGLRYASPLGQAWLGTLRLAETQSGTDLPSPIWSAAAWLRTGATQGSLRASVPGGQAVIEASSGGGDGSIALVISAVAAPAAVEVPVTWHLTPAESRVAALVAQGLSNREVAERLSVSENTVTWHLSRVFSATGIPNRTQLAARLMRRNDADPSPG